MTYHFRSGIGERQGDGNLAFVGGVGPRHRPGVRFGRVLVARAHSDVHLRGRPARDSIVFAERLEIPARYGREEVGVTPCAGDIAANAEPLRVAGCVDVRLPGNANRFSFCRGFDVGKARSLHLHTAHIYELTLCKTKGGFL